MPVIPAESDWPKWLGEKPAAKDELLAMLRPCPDDVLKIWPVGAAVGNVKNTGPQLAMPRLPVNPGRIRAMFVGLETLWGVGENKNDDRFETQNRSRQW
jgi:hypothetical protein